ncbi:MAG: O-antigen ligase family protein [Verrucomicrobiales bacterium]|nr:O-antigen ligase family protein [Verrucomicrobiales bacterium]
MPAVIRTAIIYAVIVPLAVWMGYLLAAPADRSTFSYAGILALIMAAPLLLRWHHFLLVATWNLGLTIFFLPGSPPVWMLMTALSLGISVLHRTVNDKARFLSAPSITLPLIYFMAVVLFTAKLTGGIGLHALGNETAGGKSYFLLLLGILGYFALTAQRIPPKRAKLYISLFFLAGFSSVIGDLATLMPYQSSFIFALFPPSGFGVATGGTGITETTRFGGLATMGMSGVLFMLARYGVLGIFTSGRLWRPPLFGVFFVLIFFGGFRSYIILCGAVFVFQCYLERLHKTKIFPVFIFAGVIAVTLIIPFAHKLPFTFQRSLAFLPLKLDPVAFQAAESTKEWRLQIWKDALPLVPKYLLLGKGYALTRGELDVASSRAFTRYASDFETVEITGNYHSGPLSVAIPFGIWGVIAVLWFWIASLRALLFNYRYGDLELRTINSFLLASFVAKVLLFLIVFGGLYGDMFYFASLIGLSISINRGIRRPVAAPAPAKAVMVSPASPLARPHFQPSFPR